MLHIRHAEYAVDQVTGHSHFFTKERFQEGFQALHFMAGRMNLLRSMLLY
jgi:hypothetical protein